ncbi:bacterioferritin [Iamia sp. SCSIO 61187]|uniref:bacterioferritin n=1 Tax=Iamia sp. SCSIO 61187 TaxID=2722752 RepID=UPI001C638C4E|nr:bacterioferritin [Iamia sp. SCSIO 61187]QYG92735.1 bacterioferritin [Iamia sp. SCSIO 61187]
MQGDPAIIEILNEVLTAELTAVNQYWVHHRMLDNWGLKRLAEHAREESIDEMKDADRIIERILFLEGVPNMQRLNPVRVGETVPEQLASDMAVEQAAVERYNRGIALCVEKGDNGTRHLFEEHLTSEEEHLDWIEAQLSLIETIGLERYLAQQIHSDD